MVNDKKQYGLQSFVSDWILPKNKKMFSVSKKTKDFIAILRLING